MVVYALVLYTGSRKEPNQRERSSPEHRRVCTADSRNAVAGSMCSWTYPDGSGASASLLFHSRRFDTFAAHSFEALEAIGC